MGYRSVRTRAGVLTAVVVFAFGSGCQQDARRAPVAAAQAGASGSAQVAVAADPSEPATLARVTSRDRNGSPRLLVAPALAPQLPVQGRPQAGDEIARMELARHAQLLGLTPSGIQGIQLRSAHVAAGGASVYQFEQYVGSLPVFGARASVLLGADKQLVALANHLAPAVKAPLQRSAYTWAPVEEAVARAYALHAGSVLPASAIVLRSTRGEWQEFSVQTPSASAVVLHASAKRVLFPEDSLLVPAYHVELLLRASSAARTDQAYGDVLAAETGRVLYAANLTAFEAFNYRVWADAQGVPADGPLLDATPYAGAKPDRRQLAPATPVLVSMEGFNHNPQGKPDPWLLATDTVTFGNNVHAYSDRDQYVDFFGLSHRDGWDPGSDLRAEVTSERTFDRSYDLAREPDASPDQIQAAVTQIFYVTNWLHDFWYDSGFDEAAKNAQASNYGRGGEEGDPLHAEAQDSANAGALNNANMSTLSDGKSPRMQMYLWSGAPARTLVLEPALVFSDGLGAASFGPQTFELHHLPLALADDGDAVPPAGNATDPGSVSDACQVPRNVAGKIAVIDRGACTFELKAKNAQAGGAAAVLLLDNAPGHAPLNPTGDASDVTLPMLTLSYEDGMRLTTLLSNAAAPVLATQFARGPEPQRDGTIDNTIVAHEWGHYMHHRLVMCGSSACDGMSEGWADFIALMMVIRADDVFAGQVFPLAQYAAGGLDGDAGYFGIRRAPYSVELDKNPFTFAHVRQSASLPTSAPLAATSAAMNEVHNVGEVWAQALFEGYVKLIEAGRARGLAFAQIQRHMADYVVAGMKAAPVEPSFVEQRDALLLAVHALSKDDPSRSDDFSAIARGFAKRGLGIGALAPPTESRSLDEVRESFAYKGEVTLKEVRLDDSLYSCDRDGHLDAGEVGLLSVTLANTGWAPLTAGALQVLSRDEAVRITPTPATPLGALPPFGETTLRFGVAVNPAKQGRSSVRFALSSQDPEAINAHVELPVDLRYNFDDVSGAADSDDVESEQSAWEQKTDLGPAAVWARRGDAINHVWHAEDLAVPSDQSLVSPDLVISEKERLWLSFRHRYAFELGPAVAGGPAQGFDGAVLELSRDGGASWQDISKYADPGYSGRIVSAVSLAEDADDDTPEPVETNALAGRKAWIGTSPNYPEYSVVSLDLGKRFAGETLKLRFRLATDEGTGAAGWDIDDIAFGTATAPSLVNRPFSALRDNAIACPAVTPGPAAP